MGGRSANVAILYSQRNVTGSQCSSLSSTVTWSRLLFIRTSHAARFQTTVIDVSGPHADRPAKTALQYQDGIVVIKTVTSLAVVLFVGSNNLVLYTVIVCV